MSIDLEFIENPVKQGPTEEIPYRFTTTPWGVGPSLVDLIVRDLTLDIDVTATVTNGQDPTAVGDLITLPVIKALVRGHTYRGEIPFFVGTTKFVPVLVINCE